MKQILVFTTALLLQLNVIASDTTLVFQQTYNSQVFELAKKEKKAVLLYFHFDGCGACVEMEKTAFVDKKVADFYNSNFICLEINTRKGDGIETNKIYDVHLHPTFLFLDANGKELHKIVGVFSPDEFVLQAQNALSTVQSLTHFKQLFNEGRRDADFLLDYCYKLRDANQLDSLVINEYLNTQTTDDLNKEKNIKFIYEFVFHGGRVCIPFQSSAYTFMLRNISRFTPYFDLEQVNARLMFVVQKEVFNAIGRKDAAGFWNTLEALKGFDAEKEYYFKEMDGRITMWATNKHRVLTAKIAFYEKTGDTKKYNETLKEYFEIIWNDYDALNTFAWNYYLRFEDKLKLKKAVKCVKRSIKLASNYTNNDTYACLLYKLGKYNKALKKAEIAIELAKQKNIDYKETSDLILKIKEKQKK